jgi:hypothetical protein
VTGDTVSEPRFQKQEEHYESLDLQPFNCGRRSSGGLINALVTDNGFALPSREHGILCPGAVANVLIGAVSALVSWAFYGSGASIDLAQATERAQISLRLTALAGACLVGWREPGG